MLTVIVILVLSFSFLCAGDSSDSHKLRSQRPRQHESDAMGYMLQLYGKMMKDSNKDSLNENIYSFEAKSQRPVGAANVLTLRFDISAIVHEDDIREAQLRIMFSHVCHTAHRNTKDSYCILKGILDEHCDPHSAIWSAATGYQEKFTVTSTKIMTFDVTKMIKKWKERQQMQGCITLMISYKGINPIQHRQLTSIALTRLTIDPHRPVLIVHTHDSSPEENHTFLPSNIDIHKINKRQSRNNNNGRRGNSGNRSQSSRRQLTGHCGLIKYYINFKKIGLNGRIIAPRGMNVNYCSGSCVFPLATNRTIHAEIQALLHLIDENSVPNVCCSPMSYQPIVLLYFTKNNTLTLRRFLKISVKECGCA